MRILNEYIRRVLLESSKIDDIIKFCIEQNLIIIHKINEKTIKIRKGGGKEIAHFQYQKSPKNLSEGAYVTMWAYINERYRGIGLGALLYEIMIELSGEKGIVSDRNSVKPKAVRMYRYFFNNPDAYNKNLLDPKNNKTKKGWYTEKMEDDTPAMSYIQNSEYMNSKGVTIYSPRGLFDEDIMMDPETISDWKNHPLAYVYIKKDQSSPTITKLSDLGIYHGPIRAN